MKLSLPNFKGWALFACFTSLLYYRLPTGHANPAGICYSSLNHLSSLGSLLPVYSGGGGGYIGNVFGHLPHRAVRQSPVVAQMQRRPAVQPSPFRRVTFVLWPPRPPPPLWASSGVIGSSEARMGEAALFDPDK